MSSTLIGPDRRPVGLALLIFGTSTGIVGGYILWQIESGLGRIVLIFASTYIATGAFLPRKTLNRSTSQE
jgi:hypothetical protein